MRFLVLAIFGQKTVQMPGLIVHTPGMIRANRTKFNLLYDTGVITHHLEDDMFENTHWFWFVLGVIPYRISRRSVRGGWQLQARALFWTLVITRRARQRAQWTLRIPFIEKLRNAAWAAVLSLRK